MTGTELIQRVRGLLRDLGEDTLQPTPDMMNSVAGQFWNDYEVLTALNVAQDFLINRAIQSKNIDYLNMLVVRGTYFFQNTLDQGIPLNPLPADFLHYIDCKVGNPNTLHIARIYYGGDALPYVHIRHDAMFIFGKFYTILSMNGFNTGGILNYYKRPNPIIRGTFQESFLPHIYYQDIVRYASSILGTKEIHTQRDFKNYKMVTDGFKISPPTPSVASSLEM
jgi:hypothetical protein